MDGPYVCHLAWTLDVEAGNFRSIIWGPVICKLGVTVILNTRQRRQTSGRKILKVQKSALPPPPFSDKALPDSEAN
ncbi:uncharacterized protein ColSpa_00874 [Colletotrichum spaethianum]|uniref:Uncharacterized protein n=1 Tax=Colletotrichum spaethianum TaxID=700344 RepID=A0AA37L2D5_9PEZI|nr:uncharacterized protein ColSpa_00874 [Colletotrichum spaethianum]GKT40693.1 hypothetical protein ColSpa_00874 [Colletotrichum spaethianum]